MPARDRSALHSELNQLILQGQLLLSAMLHEFGRLAPESLQSIQSRNVSLPDVKRDYESWYSLSAQVVKQALPDRYDDFRAQYKPQRRRDLNHENYTISDYLIGLQATYGVRVTVGPSAAVPKLYTQVSILASVPLVLDSVIANLEGVLSADLFDSELDAAAELGKRGFFRAGGAVAGVVLEKHLKQVCIAHNLKMRKTRPTIADYNDLLKDQSVIDVPAWRLNQHLADLRNLCDHDKEREPTADDVESLVEGVRKVCKTIF